MIVISSKTIDKSFLPFNLSQLGFSQDFEIGCPILAIVKSLAVLFFKWDHNMNILRLQPQLCIYLYNVKGIMLKCKVFN